MKRLFMILPLELVLCFAYGYQQGEEMTEEEVKAVVDQRREQDRFSLKEREEPRLGGANQSEKTSTGVAAPSGEMETAGDENSVIKEVGLRNVVGARKSDIIRRF